jgi:hypothetical protein
VAAGADKTDKPRVTPVAAAAVAKPISDKPVKSELTLGEKAQMQLAMLDKSSDKTVLDESGGKFETASVDGFDTAPVDKVETASIDEVDKSATGMGGPIEQADAGSIADLTPHPATQNYPPCDPGPGDDHCIQLYEPGVRAQLASWNQPTGGLADGSSTSAMGGPYEPVDEAKVETASADAVASSTIAPGETGEPELAAHSDMQGVGGPVEAQSGYPPCSPGPGDDRCIQLYEPGVTGAGNYPAGLNKGRPGAPIRARPGLPVHAPQARR